MPATLNKTYARMLKSTKKSPYCREAILILQMLLWCDKRLTLEACNDAIIVRLEKQPGFSAKDRLFNPRDVTKVCSGLVTITSSKGHLEPREHEHEYLQLAHASVCEYLSSEEVIEPFHSQLAETIARSNLLRMCHTYLRYVDWDTLGEKPEKIEQRYPLAKWATSTWPAHANYVEAMGEDKLFSVLDFSQQACVLSEHFFKYSVASFR